MVKLALAGNGAVFCAVASPSQVQGRFPYGITLKAGAGATGRAVRVESGDKPQGGKQQPQPGNEERAQFEDDTMLQGVHFHAPLLTFELNALA